MAFRGNRRMDDEERQDGAKTRASLEASGG